MTHVTCHIMIVMSKNGRRQGRRRFYIALFF